ncbi:MAG: helix-turn-helix domain-containing protein [Bacilli bacterium]|nr:helix-turn-helix domain-containing protein [Bacilli bacterium]
MVTQLGKILRIIRINTGDSMRSMAQKLDLSVSYLSAIENGKRNVPADFEEKFIQKYDLSDKDRENLRNAITQTTENLKVNITELSEKKRKLIYALSKDQLDDETVELLCEIIEKKGNQ